MEDEHLNTISETESDKENESSVKDLNLTPRNYNDHFNAESDLIESLLNRDTSMVSSPKINSLLEEFFGELAHIDLIPPRIDEADFDPEDDIRLVKNYDDVYFDIELDMGVLTTKVVDDISDNSTRELYVHVPNVLPILPTLYPAFDTFLSFSSENEDKIFNPGILISKEEKSPHLLSYRGFKVFQLINDSESPMMIYGGDIPILDVPYLISTSLTQFKYGGIVCKAQD
ncbi:hypothetical protein Tco_1086483 [Tanacetum coccineum]